MLDARISLLYFGQSLDTLQRGFSAVLLLWSFIYSSCIISHPSNTVHTMQTNLAVKQNKNNKLTESPWNQSGRKGKGLWRKGFAEKPSQ